MTTIVHLLTGHQAFLDRVEKRLRDTAYRSHDEAQSLAAARVDLEEGRVIERGTYEEFVFARLLNEVASLYSVASTEVEVPVIQVRHLPTAFDGPFMALSDTQVRTTTLEELRRHVEVPQSWTDTLDRETELGRDHAVVLIDSALLTLPERS